MNIEQIEKMAQEMIEAVRNEKGRTEDYKAMSIENIIEMKNLAIANLSK